MIRKPKVLILKTDGINCDEELSYAFELSGGDPKTVHINELRKNKKYLDDFQILSVPGGFSYGDDIVSGKILAVELASFFEDSIRKFIQRKNTLVIGICNGFQVLIRTGLLPFDNLGGMDATLTNNDSGHFECRWVDLEIDKNTSCVFLKNLAGQTVSYQVAHGEGKFLAEKDTLDKIEKDNLVAFRYIDSNGKPTQKYPKNPNGSLNAISGITDLSGRVLGLMPHPERFIFAEQHPNWRRKILRQAADTQRGAQDIAVPQGLLIFESMIDCSKKL